MLALLRKYAATVAVAAVTAAVTAGGPALAHAVRSGIDADTVDGFHAVGCTATATKRAGKLLATCANGKFPNSVIAKAPNADKLDGIDSTGFLQNSGLTRLAASGLNWHIFQGQDAAVSIGSVNFGVSSLNRSTAGTGVAVISPDVPDTLYGHPLQVTGAILCYDARDASAAIDEVDFEMFANGIGIGTSPAAEVVDQTNRDDDTCRQYTLAQPETLIDEMPMVVVTVNFTGGGDVLLGRVTVLAEPAPA